MRAEQVQVLIITAGLWLLRAIALVLAGVCALRGNAEYASMFGVAIVASFLWLAEPEMPEDDLGDDYEDATQEVEDLKELVRVLAPKNFVEPRTRLTDEQRTLLADVMDEVEDDGD